MCLLKSVVLLLCAVSSALASNCECGLKTRSRVFFGEDAQKHEFPWLVHVRSDKGSCGGAIIGPRSVLTAAHCLHGHDRNATSVEVEIAKHETFNVDGTIVKAKSYTLHPKYDYYNLINDIAIVTLEEPLQYTSKVSSICLPSEAREDHLNRLTLAGWGLSSIEYDEKSNRSYYASPAKLQKADIHYISPSDCYVLKYWFYHKMNNWDIRVRHDVKEIDENHICASDLGTSANGCKGDSGSPLVHTSITGRNYALGVVSHRWGGNCGMKDTPELYTKTAPYKDFIMEHAPDACFKSYDE